MASRVKFVTREEDDKYVIIDPKTPAIRKALEEKTGKPWFKIEDQDYLAHETIRILLNLEILGREELGEEENFNRIKVLKNEELKVAESELLHKMFHELENSTDPEEKELYQQIKKRLDVKKLLGILT